MNDSSSKGMFFSQLNMRLIIYFSVKVYFLKNPLLYLRF